jgi:hypothetical protein
MGSTFVHLQLLCPLPVLLLLQSFLKISRGGDAAAAVHALIVERGRGGAALHEHPGWHYCRPPQLAAIPRGGLELL